jgi:hypothetical protein
MHGLVKSENHSSSDAAAATEKGRTYIIAESFSKYLFWVHDETNRRNVIDVLRDSKRNDNARSSVLLAGFWIAFVVGGICGALLSPRWQLGSLAAPIAALIVLIAIDLFRPIGASNEQPVM